MTEIPATPRRAWLIWGVGVGVYVLAVFHRTSLGVAGPMAAQRLEVSAGQLSSFVMLQLAMYALMQVPTGLLVDRWGPRRMLLAATLTMGTAEILFAFVTSYPLALLARGLLGVGDAMTYISVLRVAAGWFPARRYPIITSYTALFGAAGNLLATIPLTGLLHQFGWTPTFLVAGGISLLYAPLLLRKARSAPFREVATVAATGPVAGTRVFGEVKSAWRMPGGRLGFWVHFTTMAAPVVFGVLWGFPYLTQAIGLTVSGASTLLLTMVLIGLAANLLIGRLLARTPEIRTPLAIAVSVACLLGWVVLISWPGGRPPIVVVVIVVAFFAIGGPASSVAFQLARDYNPRHRISTATGLVNVGGFCGAVIGTFAVGQILDLVDGPTDRHSPEAFRWAFVALALLTAFGVWRTVTWWLRTRAVVLLAAARGEEVPVSIVAHRWELVDEAILADVARATAERRALESAPDPMAKDARPGPALTSTATPDPPVTQTAPSSAEAGFVSAEPSIGPISPGARDEH